MRTYPIRYLVEFGAYTIKDIEPEWGAADALLIASLVRKAAHEGPLSMGLVTADGTNNSEEMKTTEVFSVMTLLADHIIESPDAPDWQKDIAEIVMRLTRRAKGIDLLKEDTQ